MSDWQAIETAPRGVLALFLIKWSDVPTLGEWDGSCFRASTEHVEVSCGSFCYGGRVVTERGCIPTHWIPLPEALA